MQKWEYCKLQGHQITFLGAAGLFENKEDQVFGDRNAWNRMEEEGWELVSVVMNSKDETIAFFKRPVVQTK